MDAQHINIVLLFTCLFALGKQCGENERVNTRGSKCQPTCDNPDILCPQPRRGSSCECIPGYLRNNSGMCIPQENCPPKECPENEEWRACGTYCVPTCKQPEVFCPAVCTTPGCFCVGGLVRNNNWECIKQEDCPKGLSNTIESQ